MNARGVSVDVGVYVADVADVADVDDAVVGEDIGSIGVSDVPSAKAGTAEGVKLASVDVSRCFLSVAYS